MNDLSKPYFSKLDTLRFIAFFLVFWDHGFGHIIKSSSDSSYYLFIEPFLKTGQIGVQIFFVMSAFLINYLMIHEYELYGKINIKSFYMRRILRIWPLYYFILIPSVFILPHISSVFQYCGNPYLALTFLNNLDVFDCYSPHVKVAWSIAIEEQFYLVWPLIFTCIYKKPLIKYLVCIGFFFSSLFFIYNNSGIAYSHILGNVIFLITGCLGAFVIKDLRLEKSILFMKFLRAQLPTSLFFIILLAFFRTTTPFVYYISALLLPLFFLLIIFWFCFANYRKQNGIDYLGRHTYGMYFYHSLALLATYILFDLIKLDYHKYKQVHFAVPFIAFIGTILISILSFNLLEKKFLIIKKRFAYILSR